MGLRFNPPPGWPPAPEGFTPPPGWQPDPSWPPAPPGWQLWVSDDTAPEDIFPAGRAFPGASGSTFPGAPEGTFPAAAPGQVPPYQPYGSAPPVFMKPGTNGWAIASLILGLVGGILLSVIFGLYALSKIRKEPQQGKGMAIAGLVLSGVWVLALVAGIAVSAATSAQRSAATGNITHQGNVSIFSLQVGDCFQNPSGTGIVHLSQVTAVPCTTAHNAQVFAAFQASDASYPGQTAMRTEAAKGCRARISSSLDRSKLTTTMSLHFIFPIAQSWADDQREISCLVVDSTPDLTSSLLAANPAG